MLSPEWFLDQALAGRMFHACSAGAVTLSTVNATCTGMSLENPWGSGVLVVVKEVRFQPSTAPAGAAVVGLAISPALSQTAVIHTTPAVIHNALMSGSDKNVGKAKVDVSSTLPAAPVWLRPLGSVVAASSISPGMYEDNVNGDIILPPGANLSFSYLTTAAVGIAAMSWVELPQ